MKTKLTASLLILLFVLSSNTYAAEYNSRNIDGIEFAMENAYALSVPLDVEMDKGVNWLEAH